MAAFEGAGAVHLLDCDGGHSLEIRGVLRAQVQAHEDADRLHRLALEQALNVGLARPAGRHRAALATHRVPIHQRVRRAGTLGALWLVRATHELAIQLLGLAAYAHREAAHHHLVAHQNQQGAAARDRQWPGRHRRQLLAQQLVDRVDERLDRVADQQHHAVAQRAQRDAKDLRADLELLVAFQQLFLVRASAQRRGKHAGGHPGHGQAHRGRK